MSAMEEKPDQLKTSMAARAMDREELIMAMERHLADLLVLEGEEQGEIL